QAHTEGIRYEIIVVDNGSTLDDGARAFAQFYSEVSVIANASNRGFGAACNQGFVAAGGRHVLFLNVDTRLTDDALSRAVQYLDAQPAVGALGILHCNDDAAQSFQPSFYPFGNPWQSIISLLRPATGAAESRAASVPPEQDVGWLCGS